MINVIDEVLAAEPKYTITHSDNTTEEVSIDLATTVTTQGTPLNKALFDSINADIQARVLISDKATTVEAQALTNDSHYMTPLKVKEGLQYLTKTGSASNSTTTAQTTTMLDMTDTIADAKRIIVSGMLKAYSNSSIKINGTGLRYDDSATTTTVTFSVTGALIGATYNPFKMEIDLNAKTIYCVVNSNVSSYTYTTLTNIAAELKATSSYTTEVAYTITYMY